MPDDIAGMMRDIRLEVQLTKSWIGKEHLDARVLAAMEKVPRHEFVPQELDYLAYSNGPLGIGHGQTISQPYIVALMTDLLEPSGRGRGAGGGNGIRLSGGGVVAVGKAGL